MKKTLITLLITVPVVSIAAERVYIGVEGGLSSSRVTKAGLFQDSYINTDAGVSTVKGGYAFDNGISAELALTKYENITADYCSGNGWINKGDKFTAKSKILMGNLYYHHPFATNFSGYLLAGLGIAFNNIRSSTHHGQKKASESETGLARQIGGGLSYAFTNHLLGDIGIKYVYHNNLSDRFSIDLASFDTTIGLRYMF